MSSLSFKSFAGSFVLGVLALSFASVPTFAMDSAILAKVVSTGDLVTVNTYNTVLNLRNAPCGDIIALAPSMGTGMVASDSRNNTKMMCNGGNWTWVRVNFANNSGFVAAEYLAKINPKMPNNECQIANSIHAICYNLKKEEMKVEPKMSTNECQMMLLNGICYNNDGTPKMELKQSKGVMPAEMPKANIGNIWMTGSNVHVNTILVPVQVRSTPCGTRTALAWPGATGTLMNNDHNFVKATCNGGTFSWVDVDFGGGARGWVAKEYLKSHVNM